MSMTAHSPFAPDFVDVPPVSATTLHIAGLQTIVYGLDELPAACKEVAVLWLLHPRGQTQEIMAMIATPCIADWNAHRGAAPKGLLAVSLDQRNHGTRAVLDTANLSWREGNETHAQDMFGVYSGTALDTSLLIDHLESYILRDPGSPSIVQHLALGVSLGGHSVWQLLFNEPRITAGVVIIGCPDYLRVMTDRARLSKRQTYTATGGADFLGSRDFPPALIKAVEKRDPRGQLFGTADVPEGIPPASEHARLTFLLQFSIGGKRILTCSGGADKLVPYAQSQPFLDFLATAVGPDGWLPESDIYFENNVYDGAGHVFSPPMVADAVRFVRDTLAGTSSKVDSKI